MNRDIIPRARLYFAIAEEKLEAFAVAYQKRVVPQLERHGLRDGIEQAPPIASSIFSRIFALDDLSEIARIDNALRDDPNWAKLLYELGLQFGSTRQDGIAVHSFSLYEIPARPGKIAPLGPGTNSWFSYDVTDGIAGGQVKAIAEDHTGNIWLGCRGGISSFDGLSWRTYTTRDGLISNYLLSLHCDHKGRLWCGTSNRADNGGLHLFDGQRWNPVPCPTDRTDHSIRTILYDRQNQLWCGTGKGLYCLRGDEWTSYTQAEGLVSNSVNVLCEDRSGNLWVGTNNGLSHFDGRAWTSDISPRDTTGSSITAICEDDRGRIWIGSWNFGAACLDGNQWTHFNHPDTPLYRNGVHSLLPDRKGAVWIGTVHNLIHTDGENWLTVHPEEISGHIWARSLLEDREGNVWVGCADRVYRYDRNWAHFGRSHGLPKPEVTTILEDQRGQIWLGSYASISSLDRNTLTTYTEADGLPICNLWGMSEHPQGEIWFATWFGALRYNGQTFRLFNAADGLSHLGVSIYSGSHQDNTLCIHIDSKGIIWLGMQLGGLVRYDGHSFQYFSKQDGLPDDNIQWISEDHNGHIWICCGGQSGIARYDGDRWHAYGKDDGLVDGMYSCIIEDTQGRVWLAAEEGASCFDGEHFTNYTREQGLTQEGLWSLFEDGDGHLWFGSSGGGINRYDGQVFQSLSRKDGLANNSIHQILQDRQDQYWFATNNGVTCFQPPPATPPSIRIDAVVAGQRYTGDSPIEISDSINLVSFEFSALSLKTASGHIVYRYRLRDFDNSWTNTQEQRAEYVELPIGEYIFEVVAVDRDLEYSDLPATCVLQVVRDERDAQIGELEQRVQERTHQLEETHHQLQETQARLIAELENELQKAHEMQMRLMPTTPPQTEGFEIDGRCIPASHVGGDFFQYFHRGNKISLCIADVTGHAMEAAIPVVMFSGVLDAQIENKHILEELFDRLNRTLYRNLDRRTFVCFTMAEIDLKTRILRMANGGCPYPLHFSAATQTISEIQVEAYPLGVRGDTQYSAIEASLATGDQIVFCSDGIIEAINAQQELFGFERTMDTVYKGCLEQLPASGLIDYLLAAVREFAGKMDQADDMTCVVVKVR